MRCIDISPVRDLPTHTILTPNPTIKPMNPVAQKHHSRRPILGFTLVEMLVVIAIMSILRTAGAIGLGGMGGKGVTSGVASAESMFDEARATATGKRLRTAVLVAKTLTNNSSEDLRKIVVVTEEIDRVANSPTLGQAKNPTSATPTWELSSRGVVLPDQTFFSREYSKKDHSGSGAIDEVTDSNIKDSNGVTLKPASPFKGSYYIYEINSEGICKTPGASFVIGAGSRVLSKSATVSAPRVTSAGVRDFGGFVIWRNGGTSVFRSPEQINTDLKSIKAGDDF